jgi:hypothetical protein
MTRLVSLRYFNDGAENPSNWRQLDAGQTGSFVKEMIARRLGFAKHRVWEICDTSSVAADILGMSIDMESE